MNEWIRRERKSEKKIRRLERKKRRQKEIKTNEWMVKVCLCTPLKRMGNGDIAPRILNLGTTWKWCSTSRQGRCCQRKILRTYWMPDCVGTRTGPEVLQRDIWSVPRIESRFLSCLLRRLFIKWNELCQHKLVNRRWETKGDTKEKQRVNEILKEWAIHSFSILSYDRSKASSKSSSPHSAI
jgi:hypothetical protein